MTTLNLNTLSERIKAHKTALVHIVKPPVCTERAQHYTEMYQQHLDKPIWRITWPSVPSGSSMTS